MRGKSTWGRLGGWLLAIYGGARGVLSLAGDLSFLYEHRGMIGTVATHARDFFLAPEPWQSNVLLFAGLGILAFISWHDRKAKPSPAGHESQVEAGIVETLTALGKHGNELFKQIGAEWGTIHDPVGYFRPKVETLAGGIAGALKSAPTDLRDYFARATHMPIYIDPSSPSQMQAWLKDVLLRTRRIVDELEKQN